MGRSNLGGVVVKQFDYWTFSRKVGGLRLGLCHHIISSEKDTLLHVHVYTWPPSNWWET